MASNNIDWSQFKPTAPPKTPSAGGIDFSQFKPTTNVVPSTPMQAQRLNKPIPKLDSGLIQGVKAFGTGLEGMAKAAWNTPVSAAKTAWGMTGGQAVEAGKMIGQTVSGLPKLPGQIADVASKADEIPGALGSLAGEFGKAGLSTLEGMVPGITALFQGDTQKAADYFTNDPVGQVAMPVLIALGEEGRSAEASDLKFAKSAESDVMPIDQLSKNKAGTPLASAVEKVGKPVVEAGKTAAKVGAKVAGLPMKAGAYGLGLAGGLSPNDVSTAINGAGKLSEAIRQGKTREGLTDEIVSSINDKHSEFTSTGKPYEAIRKSGVSVNVPQGTFDDVLKSKGFKVVDGKLSSTPEAPHLTPGELGILQKWYDQYGKENILTGNGFLNARSGLSEQVDYGAATSGNLDRLSTRSGRLWTLSASNRFRDLPTLTRNTARWQKSLRTPRRASSSPTVRLIPPSPARWPKPPAWAGGICLPR